MKILIIGGTGTLGKGLIGRLYRSNNKIVCFSRCELKQKELKAKYPNVEYVIGDIRDKDALNNVMKNCHTVFHLAALKHVDVVEENPTEGIKRYSI